MSQSRLINGNKSTTKNRIIKTVFDWAFNILCLVLVIFALLMAIASISRTQGQQDNGIGISSLGNITYAPVASNSMEDTIMVGDLAVGRKYDDRTLQIGEIITFRSSVMTSDGVKPILNTHRIVGINYAADGSGKIISYVTKGDNPNAEVDSDAVYSKNILSVYKTTYKGLGKPILWLQSDPMHFFLGVVLPIIILFIIYAIIFIRALVNAALGKKRLAAATVDGLSEEDKKRLAEEYLAQLAKEQQDKDNKEENKLDSKTADDNSSSDDK